MSGSYSYSKPQFLTKIFNEPIPPVDHSRYLSGYPRLGMAFDSKIGSGPVTGRYRVRERQCAFLFSYSYVYYYQFASYTHFLVF